MVLFPQRERLKDLDAGGPLPQYRRRGRHKRRNSLAVAARSVMPGVNHRYMHLRVIRNMSHDSSPSKFRVGDSGDTAAAASVASGILREQYGENIAASKTPNPSRKIRKID